MPMTPQELLGLLERRGVAAKTVSHPPLLTVADSQALRGEIEGGHIKNLFVKDKKGRYFLVTAGEEARIDLKTVHQVIGASGRVSFGSADQLMALLGVVPGAVTPFGLVNDADGRVTFVLDAGLFAHTIINAHPLTNTMTTSIRREDLVAFIEATGHSVNVLKVAD